MTLSAPFSFPPAILRPEELPSVDRGSGARTIPLVTAALGATSFLNGITTFEPGAAIGHHTHNTVESVVIIEGDAIVEIDGVETALSVHDTTFVPANIPHRFKNASTEKRMRILWVYASTEATRTLIASGETGRIDGEHPGGSTSAQQRSGQSVQEVAEIDVIPGTETLFEAAVAAAAPLFQAASGCRTLELRRSVEYPSRYRLCVDWDTVEHHTVAFRESDNFAAWRALVGEYFQSPPRVEHTASVLKAF